MNKQEGNVVPDIKALTAVKFCLQFIFLIHTGKAVPQTQEQASRLLRSGLHACPSSSLTYQGFLAHKISEYSLCQKLPENQSNAFLSAHLVLKVLWLSNTMRFLTAPDVCHDSEVSPCVYFTIQSYTTHRNGEGPILRSPSPSSFFSNH